MAVNFPDPATQTPVNTFSPTSSPLATTNGFTYTFDGSKWVSAGVNPNWDRTGTTVSPATAGDSVDLGSGDLSAASARVGGDTAVGVSSPLQVNGSTGITAHRGSTGAGEGAMISLSRSRNTTLGSNTIVEAGDEIGKLTFRADDGTDSQTEAAKITCFADTTVAENSVPGRLVFSTRPNGDTQTRDRMVLNKNGNLLIGGTDPLNSPNIKLEANGKGTFSTGVLFGSDTADANTLDDYEEGTWTPAWVASYGNAPATAGSFTSAGTYVKTGKTVTLFVNIDFNDGSAVTVDDRININGIPFTSDGGTITGTGVLWQYQGVSSGNNAFWASGVALHDATNIYLYCIHKDGGSIDYTRNIRGYITYNTN